MPSTKVSAEQYRCRTCRHKGTDHRRILLQGTTRCRALTVDGKKCPCTQFLPIQIHLVPKENL